MVIIAESELSCRYQMADADRVDRLIDELDHRISQQLDEILHHPLFQQLESAWRGLKLVVDHTDFRENIKVEALNVSKEDLVLETQDSPSVLKNGLYEAVGPLQAYCPGIARRQANILFANFSFWHNPENLELLQRIAEVAALIRGPVIAAAAPKLFGLDDDFMHLPEQVSKDGKLTLHSGPEYVQWQAFRDTELSRYVGLVVPRFLIRRPHRVSDERGEGEGAFRYQENVSRHEFKSWTNGCFAFAVVVARSFCRYRHCANIIGRRDGRIVETENQEGDALVPEFAVECELSERQEYELSLRGFVPLVWQPELGVHFMSAESCYQPKGQQMVEFDSGAIQSPRYNALLPHVYFLSCFAQYLARLCGEHLLDWKTRDQVQQGLQQWLEQFVDRGPPTSARDRACHPLLDASIALKDSSAEPKLWEYELRLCPRWKYFGHDFCPYLEGWLEKVLDD